MEKKLLLIVFSFLLSQDFQAQTTEWLYTLDTTKPFIYQVDNKISSLDISKAFDSKYADIGNYLFEKIKAGEIIVYKDAFCKYPFDESEIDDLLYEDTYTIDTTIIPSINDSIPPQKNINKRIRTSIFPNKETGYLITQDWFIDTNKNVLQTDILTIKVFNTAYDRTLFYIKNDTNKHKPDFDNSLIWGKNMMILGRHKNKKTFKGIAEDNYLTKVKLADKDGNILTKEDVKDKMFFTDTFTVWDSMTQQMELKTVIYSNYNPVYFKVAQHLFFDASTNSFSLKILAFAPMKEFYNDQVQFLRMEPIFWIIYDDDFLKTFD